MKNDFSHWTTAHFPQQHGKRVVITGTGGLGYETALVLARKGADVILAGRNEAKGRESLRKIRAFFPDARIRFEMLDLASLKSVAVFAERMTGENLAIDILVNNAAVMSLPKRQVTADGFEMQFGTNYLGHFALTAQLLPLLRLAPQPRVVHVSSLAHRLGSIRFDDLQAEKSYNPWVAYTQSKLANLIFSFELQRRSDDLGWGLMSNAAHPGYARTELIRNGPGANSLLSRLGIYLLQPFLSHSAAEGALPTLVAAIAPDAEGGGYYGPNGFYEMKGPPAPAYVLPKARDLAVAKRLWEVSENLTGVTWAVEKAAV